MSPFPVYRDQIDKASFRQFRCIENYYDKFHRFKENTTVLNTNLIKTKE